MAARALARSAELRIVEAERLARGSSFKPGSRLEAAAAEAVGASPFDRALPESERRRAGDDQRRLDAARRRSSAAVGRSTQALSARLKPM